MVVGWVTTLVTAVLGSLVRWLLRRPWSPSSADRTATRAERMLADTRRRLATHLAATPDAATPEEARRRLQRHFLAILALVSLTTLGCAAVASPRGAWPDPPRITWVVTGDRVCLSTTDASALARWLDLIQITRPGDP